MPDRFNSKEEIIALIDRYRKERDDLLKDAEQDDILADHLRETKEAWRIERIRDEAVAKRSRAGWREARLKNLGDSLSTIQTPELPECKTDGSIPTS